MSQGGTDTQGKTKRELRREQHKELMDKLTLVAPKPGDVFVIEIAADLYEQPEYMQAATTFAQDVNRITGRDIFIMREGYSLHAIPDPRPPDVAVPKPRIYLPESVKL